MSYGFNNPCYDCILRIQGCTDEQNIKDGIQKCWNNLETHKGSGTVILHCGHFQPLPKVGKDVCYVLDKGPCVGQARPAKVVQVFGDDGTCNLVIFLDGLNDVDGGAHTGDRGDNPIMWATSVHYSAKNEFGHWHW